MLMFIRLAGQYPLIGLGHVLKSRKAIHYYEIIALEQEFVDIFDGINKIIFVSPQNTISRHLAMYLT